MPTLTIDWTTATVHDGTLTVELSEAPSPKWRKRAKGAIGVLERPGHGWGEVSLKKQRLVVADLSEGGEDDVRHFLESIVLQANGSEASDAAQPETADTRMTAAFQAFGEGESR